MHDDCVSRSELYAAIENAALVRSGFECPHSVAMIRDLADRLTSKPSPPPEKWYAPTTVTWRRAAHAFGIFIALGDLTPDEVAAIKRALHALGAGTMVAHEAGIACGLSDTERRGFVRDCAKLADARDSALARASAAEAECERLRVAGKKWKDAATVCFQEAMDVNYLLSRSRLGSLGGPQRRAAMEAIAEATKHDLATAPTTRTEGKPHV